MQNTSYTPESSEEYSWELRIISSSAENTRDLGKALVSFLVPGTLVGLFGELGTGKTEFVRGFVGDRVKSPSFTLHNIYSNGFKVHHFDLFRLHAPVDPDQLGLTEVLAQRDGCVFVEWADRLAWLPAERLDVAISFRTEHQRTIEIACYLPWFDLEGFTHVLNERSYRYELY